MRDIYIIKDVWLMLATLRSLTFFLILIYIVLLFSVTLIQINNEQLVEHLRIISIIYGTAVLMYLIQVFIVFNKGYVIDLKKEEFRFPATDVENSLIDILTFKKYFDYARIKKIALKDISDIYMDRQTEKIYSITTNKTTKTIFTINIVGFHGSNNLNFSSRQKRDEVRGLLVQAAKKVKVGIKDRKTAELD